MDRPVIFHVLGNPGIMLPHPRVGLRDLIAYAVSLVALGTSGLIPVAFADDSRNGVNYLRDIKPLLAARCYACHGGLKQEAGLRLDTGKFVARGGDSGPAFQAGTPATSLMIQRVTADESERMPPEGEPLTRREIELLAAWIQQGGSSPEEEQPQEDAKQHWAFQPAVRPSIPQPGNPAWTRNPIDAFVAARHEQHGLKPRPLARKEVLLRRVYLDLIGIPPNRQQLAAFLADDTPYAYERVVDYLLGSPHYGERWGRHWMDVWRYSDWYGRRAANDVRTSSAQIWRWRDWIISSLNDDKGYDRMVQEMLAGDELAPEDPDVVVATGFIMRNCYRLNFHTWKQDMVEHTGKALLGLTFNCAHCHDHKYDPITQEHYFQLRAFFEPLMARHDRLPGLPDPGPFEIYDFHGNGHNPVKAGLARVYDGFPEEPTRMYHRGDPRNVMADKTSIAPAVPKFLADGGLDIAPIDLPPAAYYPGAKPYIQREERARRQRDLSSSELALKESERTLPAEQVELQAKLEQATSELTAATLAMSESLRRVGESAPVEPPLPGQPPLLGEWRFEGDEETELLADSGPNGLTLLRSTGNDERVSAVSLPITGRGRGFRDLALGRNRKNHQALLFDQQGGESFFYTIAGDKLRSNQLTIEVGVHLDQMNGHRTLVEYHGVWALEHQGLSPRCRALTLRIIPEQGPAKELSSNTGETPLLLFAGHDYYLAVTIDEQNITFFAKNLTADGDLQSVQIARGPELAKIAEPGERARLNIGRSQQGQRHGGLLDELRLSSGPMTATEIAARANSTAEMRRMVTAERAEATARGNLDLRHLDHTICKLRLAEARVQKAVLEARIAADRARYVQRTRDAHSKALAANQAERVATMAQTKLQLAQAMHTVAKAEVALWSAPEQIKQLATAEQQLEQIRPQVTTAIEKSLHPPADQYTSVTQVFPQASTGRRTALARWITDPQNPLTARVAVNHIWLRHFGAPLVETVSDFGRNGRSPTHPKLLDWLAVEFMKSKTTRSGSHQARTVWSMKRIHRLIVTSNTYRLESKTATEDATNRTRDPQNRFLWHFNSRRMESEVVRDSLLACTGRLDRAFGGPDIDVQQGSNNRRRSLYFTIHPEGGILEFMSVFDPPDPCSCYQRDESIIPQQALAMTNSRLMITQSRLFARRLWSEVSARKLDQGSPVREFIASCFAQILGRYPTTAEQEACREFLAEQSQLFQQAEADELVGNTPEGEVAPSSDVEMRARESLIGALFSHNDFVTIR